MALIPSIEQQIASDKNVLHLKVLSPRKEFFNGLALSVSSINSSGKFDVLSEHGNMVTLIQNSPIAIRLLNRKTITFAFPLAVVYVRKNFVTIFTDIHLELLTS